MSDDLPTLEEILASLRHEIQLADRNVVDFGKRHYNGLREKLLIFCLDRASDLAKGISVASDAKLSESVYVLARGIFEVFIQVYWISQSPENAKQFDQEQKKGLSRTVRSNLQKGYASVFDRNTKADKTQEFLNSSDMKKKIPILRFDEMASNSGIEKLCTMLYGFLSNLAHGYTFNMAETLTAEEIMRSTITLADASLTAINAIASQWIIHRKQVSVTEIYNILGMSQYKPKS